MPSLSKQQARSSDNLRGLRYVSTGLLGAAVGMAIGKVIVPIIGVKNPQLALALTGLTATCLSYVGLSGSRAKDAATTLMDHYVTKSVVALAFAATANYLGNLSDQNDKEYRQARAAIPFVDSKTVLGTREYTVADEHCRHNHGARVDFDHNGKKSYTLCPR